MNNINHNIREVHTLNNFRNCLGLREGVSIDPEKIPYTGEDATCGIENEFQTAVKGRSGDVDLALYIRESRYLKNLIKRSERGDLPGKRVEEISEFIDDNRSCIWENSWVRFPRKTLSRYADAVFRGDLKSDKANPESGERRDAGNFT
ncbi:MAG TPA: hypothetical protein PKZ64_11785, partial [Spirochaetota bacterium]|nr:hypothetical protein [Spirochaetota bacterium]